MIEDDVRKEVLTSDILSNFANGTRKTFNFPRDFPDDYFHSMYFFRGWFQSLTPIQLTSIIH